MSARQLLFNLAQIAPARREWHNGKEYFVAPMSLLPAGGVLSGSKGALYYPPEEVSATHHSWNHIPITIRHPTRNGEPVSARDPDVLDNQGIGFLTNDRVDGGKRKATGYIEVERVRKMDPRIYNALNRGEPMELSTGLYTDNEPKPGYCPRTGRGYDYIARNYRPDHLAILPDETGACSVRDGCGVLVNAGAELTVNEATVDRAIANVFCATGEGGGVDATCKVGSGIGEDHPAIKMARSLGASEQRVAEIKDMIASSNGRRSSKKSKDTRSGSVSPPTAKLDTPKAAPATKKVAKPVTAETKSQQLQEKTSDSSSNSAKTAKAMEGLKKDLPELKEVSVSGPRAAKTFDLGNGRKYTEEADPRHQILMSTERNSLGTPTTMPGDKSATGVGFSVDHDDKHIHIYEMTSKIKGAGTRITDSIVKHFPGYKISLNDWSNHDQKHAGSFWDEMARRHPKVFTNNRLTVNEATVNAAIANKCGACTRSGKDCKT